MWPDSQNCPSASLSVVTLNSDGSGPIMEGSRAVCYSLVAQVVLPWKAARLGQRIEVLQFVEDLDVKHQCKDMVWILRKHSDLLHYTEWYDWWQVEIGCSWGCEVPEAYSRVAIAAALAMAWAQEYSQLFVLDLGINSQADQAVTSTSRESWNQVFLPILFHLWTYHFLLNLKRVLVCGEWALGCYLTGKTYLSVWKEHLALTISSLWNRLCFCWTTLDDQDGF